MKHPSVNWRAARSITTCVMLVCSIYQLGACPCGCLEHNAWAQMLGLASHDHDHGPEQDSMSSDFGVVSSLDHDCKGHPWPLYVNNAETTERHFGSRSSSSLLAFDTRPPACLVQGVTQFEHRPPPSVSSSRADLAKLQVFLL